MAFKSTTETVAEIRAELKKEFPDFKFSVRKRDYNSMNITILSAPINLLEGSDKKYERVNEYYIEDHYKDNPKVRDILKKIKNIAFKDVTYRETGDYGNQPSFYITISIGEYDKPFEYKPKKGASKPATSGAPVTPRGKFDRGVLLKDCAGWKITKKTLPDGRVVYNATKDKDTPPNKGDWSAIKGEIYIGTGFKWGRFGAFEKWGEIEKESEVLNDLCNILSKYYTGATTPTPATTPTSDDFIYGESFGVPKSAGKDLMVILDSFGLNPEIFGKSTKKTITIDKDGGIMLSVSDSGGKFNINLEPSAIFVTSIPYYRNDTPVSPFTLAKEIEAIYIQQNQAEPTDEPEPIVVNESYKSVPANPKLEYCKILWAEGSFEYGELYPREFTSFTALTKFIADNIPEIPTIGYDKHKVEYKWKFSDDVLTDRWDVSETEANPKIYPNLYASEYMLHLCYQAWKKDSDSVNYSENDLYLTNVVGKDGLELNNEQFNEMLTGYLTYYGDSDAKRFEYNTTESRLERFKECYPNLYNLFQQPETQTTQAQIEEAKQLIEALNLLGDNEEAKSLIEALKIVINS
jgi:hypothetical protein